MIRWLLFLVLASAGSMQAAAVRPFTLEIALAGITKQYPQATMVSADTPTGVSAREDIVYYERPGQSLGLDLYRLADEQVRPAVIIVHGGGWLAGSRQMERALAKQLALRGYVAVPITYRLGEPGRYPAAVLDLKAAVRWLRLHAADYHIDSDRIGAVGGSAGGTLVTFLGATNGNPIFEEKTGNDRMTSSAVQAVVDIDGAASFLDNALIAQAEKSSSPYYVYMHGIYSEARETWVDASPINYVGPASAPTLFLKSTSPSPILPGRDEMSARLKIFRVDSDVIQFPNTPHVFWLFHPWFNQVVDATDSFLARHLKRAP